MKFWIRDDNVVGDGPTPQGVGGLKLSAWYIRPRREPSHPARGGWIEIFVSAARSAGAIVPPRKGWVD